MKRSFFHRIIALFMAIYLPAALVGVPLHKHYCQGKLADVKVFVETESCHGLNDSMKDCCGTESTACHSTQDKTHNDLDECGTGSSCCDDQMELLRADVTLITQNTTELDTDHAGIINLSHAFVLTQSADQQFLSYINYAEPPGPFLDGQDRLLRFGYFLC